LERVVLIPAIVNNISAQQGSELSCVCGVLADPFIDVGGSQSTKAEFNDSKWLPWEMVVHAQSMADFH
jgi:hypothetical protein